MLTAEPSGPAAAAVCALQMLIAETAGPAVRAACTDVNKQQTSAVQMETAVVHNDAMAHGFPSAWSIVQVGEKGFTSAGWPATTHRRHTAYNTRTTRNANDHR